MNDPFNVVDGYERLWTSEAPPVLESYLAGFGDVALDHLSRLVRVDLTQRWHRGERPLAETYLKRFPDVNADDDCSLDLIYHEYLLREKLGEPPSMSEFTNRFPRHAAALAEQIHLHKALSDVSASGDDASAADANLTSLSTCNAKDNLSVALECASGELRQLGRYRLLNRVGAGAFGVVYRAHDSGLDRIVAVKIPRDGDLSGPSEIERFWREARSVAQLRHPSIVSVHEIGRFNQTPFLVSEFVVGKSLAVELAGRKMAPAEAADLVAALADALHYAHEMGVVHRDVKPANIMLDESGRPRLMDFGLARRDAGDMTMTLDGQVLGTPSYMSPEQARGDARHVDRRSDVYSLGVILYQALTGALPFRGTARAVLHDVLHEEPPALRSVTPQTPRDLETICMRAMAKEPSGRYPTARDMADDLMRFLRREPIKARPVSSAERAWSWVRRQPAMAGLLVAVCILLVAIVAGGSAAVSILLGTVALGGTLAAMQFRRQAINEQHLREEADDTLYYYRIALAHRDLTASIPQPGRAVELLEVCPPERRHWEWHYLQRSWRSEQVVLRSPGSCEFRGIAFSHDGRLIAAACGDGHIRVWNLLTKQMTLLKGHDGFVYSVAFHPLDNSRLASSGSDGLVRVWDVTSKQESLAPLPGIKVFAVGLAYCVAFSPNGELLAAASDPDVVHVWNAATGQLVHTLGGHEIRAGGIAFSGDGHLIASGSWLGAVRIWDADSGRQLQLLQRPEHRYPVSCLAFSPDPADQSLAVGYFDNRVDVWNLRSGAIHRQLQGHAGFITSVAFSPHDARRLASTGEDRTIHIWDVHSGRNVLQLQGHLDTCAGLAFSPTGQQLASASYDHTIRLWDATPRDADQGEERHIFHLDQEVWCIAIAPTDELVAAAGEGRHLRIWNAATGRQVQDLSGVFTAVVFSVSFSPDGRFLAAAGFDAGAPACVIKVLEVESGRCVLEHREAQEIFAVAFEPNGRRLAFGLSDGSIKLLDATSGLGISLIGRHDRPIAYGGIRFRADGRRLASVSLDGTVRIWILPDAQTGRVLNTSHATPSMAALHCQMSTRSPGIAFWSVAFSPDGRTVIAGDKDGRLTEWNAETGAVIHEISDAARGAYLSVDYAPNGCWIATASEDCCLRIYDAKLAKQVREIRGHMGAVRSLAVNDRCVATGGRDKTVRIWNLNCRESSDDLQVT